MAETSLAKRLGLTPAKAIVVAILMLVLVVVLIVQFTGGDGPAVSRKPNVGRVSNSTRTRPRAVKPKNSQRSNPAPAAPNAERAVAGKPWSRMRVEEACQFNPMKMPSALVAASTKKVQAEDEKGADEKRQQLEKRLQERAALMQSLQDAGVALVIASERGAYAVIGTQVVHVGDVIQGFVVKEIGPQGVVLADQHEE